MCYHILEGEQRKKTGSVLKQNTQTTAPIQRSTSSQLYMDMMAVQAGFGNRYVQQMVNAARRGGSPLEDGIKAEMGDANQSSMQGGRATETTRMAPVGFVITNPNWQDVGNGVYATVNTVNGADVANLTADLAARLPEGSRVRIFTGVHGDINGHLVTQGASDFVREDLVGGSYYAFVDERPRWESQRVLQNTIQYLRNFVPVVLAWCYSVKSFQSLQANNLLRDGNPF